ncbi:MAG TPA: type II toxin-antitoxin system RelE/ParE family toxin [Bryobacteraceae bacterium]|nr:type II toxin-antitoxin system RelE/ParE family toxin [Bryobacteraceae bacterium]
MERRPGSPRVFKTRWFERFARKEKIRDRVLVDAVARAEGGQVDADLGGGVIKQRIARPGEGKSGGHRTIIFFRRGARAVFAYGFAKSDRANIDADEEKQFKEAARHVLRLTEKQIEELVKNGGFVELRYEQKISK